MNTIKTTAVLLSLLLNFSAQASQRVLVLDFELSDITSMPNTKQELTRTASFKPLLERALEKTGDYDLLTISPTEQAAANPSLGYLFSHDDAAADLGRKHGADWVLVTRHSKPSFLFSYLMAHLVEVDNRHLTASYDIEMKGTHEKVAQRGIDALAKKIRQTTQKASKPD